MVDYRRIEQLAVTFQPGEMRITLPFTLIDDNITEPTESFGLRVSRKLDNPNLVLGRDTAVITLQDTDGNTLWHRPVKGNKQYVRAIFRKCY